MKKEKRLILFFYNEKRFVPFPGKFFYEIDPYNPMRFGALNGYIGLSNAINADYMTTGYLRNIDQLKDYKVILLIGKFYFDINLIKKIKNKYPHIFLIGQFEENIRKHKIWCRSKKFLDEFIDFANLVDVFSTFHHKTLDYYSLFTNKPVVYLPHAYPVAWLKKKIEPKSKENKAKIILKEGVIFGRPGQDGFTELLFILNNMKELLKEYKVIVTDWPNSDIKAIKFFDTISQQRYSPIGKLGKIISHLIYKYPKVSTVKFLINKLNKNKEILIKKRVTWFENLHYFNNAFLSIDLDSCYTTGRNVLDSAICNTPIIGYNSDFQLQLFPELVVRDEIDFKMIDKHIKRLIDDSNFYIKTIQYSSDKLLQFSYENTYIYFNKLLENYRS